MSQVSRDWIVVGSSPGAAEWLPAVLERFPGATTITTNRGIDLFDLAGPPDHYFLCDTLDQIPADRPDLAEEGKVRFDAYRLAGIQAQSAGTHTIGLWRPPAVLTEWEFEWLDELLGVKLGSWRPWKFVPGKYTACGLSGLFCLQYAVNRGAAAVHLIGMEGYGECGHYFDAGPDSRIALDRHLTEETIAPFTQAVISACPDREFHFYGKLEYRPMGRNVTHHEDLSQWKSNSKDTGATSGPATSATSPTGPQTS